MTSTTTWVLRTAGITVLGVILFLAWQALQPNGLPDGIAASNGRIEAVEMDLASKTPGRIAEIYVNEGDFIKAGQVLAIMDSRVLDARLREAQADLQKAEIGVATSHSRITQREAEKTAAQAIVAQREAALTVAQKRLTRSEELAPKDAIPQSVLDEDRALFLSAKAAVSAAKAQVAASDAALNFARSLVISAQAEIAAETASVERIQTDINDSELKSPRDGRVQYRVAQPGEVLRAGGTVLNLVDLSDVYMTFFLATGNAGRIPLGAEVRIILDAIPQYVMPAKISFVSSVAQFTPKTVETAEERQKLVFRIKAQIDPTLLREHIQQVKTGVPGMAYVRIEDRPWPAELQIKLPE